MKTLFKKMGIVLCALAIAVGCLPANAFAAELEPAILFEENQQTIDLDQLEQRTLEDGTTLYDVTPLAVSSPIYLGAFTFTNTNVGAKRVINADEVRFIVEFKKADTQPTDIDLEIRLHPIFYDEDGNEYWAAAEQERICSMYCTETTSDGYHKYTTGWFPIASQFRGGEFRIYYDAMTEFGETGTGAYRKASVRIWMQTN